MSNDGVPKSGEELIRGLERKVAELQRAQSRSSSGDVFQVTNNIGDPQFCFARASEAPQANCVWYEGGALSRTTYAALFAKLNPAIGTPTITIGNPGVLTLTGHDLLTGQMIYLTTTGAFPTNLVANVAYFVVYASADTFSLATTLANALAGTKINTSGTQSGVHALRTTFGVGDGSTTFNVPDMRGKVPTGYKASGVFSGAIGATVGAETHTLTLSETPNAPINIKAQSTGDVNDFIGGSAATYGIQADWTAGGSQYNISYTQGGNQPHNNVQPSIIGRWYARFADVTLPPAGSTASVTAAVGTVALRDSAGRTQVVGGVTAADVANVSQLPGFNLFANPIFRVNQRAAVSAASLASGQYFIDRMKSATAANAVTWTGDDVAGRILTIPVGGVVASIQERTNFPAGVYTLSWGGTTTGRFYKSGTTAPALAASPVTVTADGLADMIAEWGAGTLSRVKIEAGSVATPLMLSTRADEERACQRYYFRFVPRSVYTVFSWGASSGTTTFNVLAYLPVEMRSTPTVTFAIIAFQNNYATPQAVTALSVDSGSTLHAISLSGSVGAGLTANSHGRILSNNSTSGRLAFDAEL